MSWRHSPIQTSLGGEQTSGNPDLKLTKVINADLRFEYFPKLSEVMAFSIFFKSFKDPIEPVVAPSGGDENLNTFQNSSGATLIGTELEARLGAKPAYDGSQ